jgi:hypothetical protein
MAWIDLQSGAKINQRRRPIPHRLANLRTRVEIVGLPWRKTYGKIGVRQSFCRFAITQVAPRPLVAIVGVARLQDDGVRVVSDGA